MTAGPLHSDHINYLILRYLQEKGHESAATAFHAEWHRPAEYTNPENLPFAHVVRRDELISVIQEGLHHDELSARVRKNQRRFRWTSVNSRDGIERQNGIMLLENGADSSRPSSAAKRKGRLPAMRAPDEFPTPAPKRQRRSEGSEGLQVNGDRDAMEVDAASASADADEDGDAVSPAVMSPEPEVIEVFERYDSMDVATQTDVKSGIKTSTMYWKIEKPGAYILHSMWNPSLDKKNGTTLMVVGESICRFYQVPNCMQDVKQVHGIAEPSMPPSSTVTASAWHPKGHVATCAIATLRDLPETTVPHYALIEYSRDTGSSAEYVDLPLLEPPHIVLAMHYSPDGSHLLVARSNHNHGLVLVYETQPSTESGNKEPIAWKIFDHQVLEIAWNSKDFSFYVCGADSQISVFNLDPSGRPPEYPVTAESVKLQGLILKGAMTPAVGCQRWDKIRHDGHSGSLVTVCIEKHTLCIHSDDSSMSFPAKLVEAIPGNVTAMAFQPPPDADNDSITDGRRFEKRSVLAVAIEDGCCFIYDVAPAKCERTCIVDLTDGAALALAWSPRGDYLAIAGPELIQIWSVTGLAVSNKPVVTWRPDVTALDEDYDKPISEPSLSWSADGESLGFALDTQIAVIRFRPSL